MLNCSDILAPTDEELMGLAYDEERLPLEEQRHFEQCSLCQGRLATYTSMNNVLLAKLHRQLCPSAVRLNYYCLAVVPEGERMSIASHLLDCPRCVDEVKEIRRIQATFEPFPVALPSLGSAMRRLFATPVVQQAQPVTRNEFHPAAWPRQYHAESLNLSLHLSYQSNGEILLLGILTSSDAEIPLDALAGVTVNLYVSPGPLDFASPQNQQPLLTTEVDDVGNLLLEPISPGKYVLILQLPDREIVIEDLHISHG